MYVVLVIVVLVFLVAVVRLVTRFRSGEAMEAGGSFGWQLFRRNKDDWGPKQS